MSPKAKALAKKVAKQVKQTLRRAAKAAPTPAKVKAAKAAAAKAAKDKAAQAAIAHTEHLEAAGSLATGGKEGEGVVRLATGLLPTNGAASLFEQLAGTPAPASAVSMLSESPASASAASMLFSSEVGMENEQKSMENEQQSQALEKYVTAKCRKCHFPCTVDIDATLKRPGDLSSAECRVCATNNQRMRRKVGNPGEIGLSAEQISKIWSDAKQQNLGLTDFCALVDKQVQSIQQHSDKTSVQGAKQPMSWYEHQGYTSAFIRGNARSRSPFADGTEAWQLMIESEQKESGTITQSIHSAARDSGDNLKERVAAAKKGASAPKKSTVDKEAKKKAQEKEKLIRSICADCKKVIAKYSPLCVAFAAKMASAGAKAKADMEPEFHRATGILEDASRRLMNPSLGPLPKHVIDGHAQWAADLTASIASTDWSAE